MQSGTVRRPRRLLVSALTVGFAAIITAGCDDKPKDTGKAETPPEVKAATNNMEAFAKSQQAAKKK